ncbi:MAG: hypothetical protein KIT16_10080 [Rhodospirillaceae bacterium]|nr:hypothetical protein [Rhodospirillaceae bacterium]
MVKLPSGRRAIPLSTLRWAGVAAWVLMAAAGSIASAFAQNRSEPIRAGLADVKANEAKARPLLKRMQDLVAQNAEKKKAYDAAEAERKGLQPRLERYNANLGKYDAALAAYSKRVDAYNAKCGGTVSQPQYRACLAEKGELAGRKLELDSAKGALETERQAIEAALKAGSDKVAGIAKEMNANIAAWEKTQKEYGAIYAKIEAMRKRLNVLCEAGEKSRDPFAVRLCVGAGWDSAKKDLTALTDLPAPAN